MPTARASSYNGEASATIYGGRFASPAWLDGSVAGDWIALPNSSLAASGVGWPSVIGSSSGTYAQVVQAWSSGILNTVGVNYQGTFIAGTFVAIFGGGHSNYGGNEVYAYGPLESSTPVWRRLIDPTIPPPTNVARDSNSYPVARHTYDSLQYDPVSNRMTVTACAAIYSNAAQPSSGQMFDFNVNPAVGMPWINTDAGFPTLTGSAVGTYAVGGYHPTSRKAWTLSKGNGENLWSFNVADSTWTRYAKDNPSPYEYSKAGLSPSLNLLVVAFSNGSLRVQNLSTPSAALYQPTVSGTVPNWTDMVLDWDEVTGTFISVSPSNLIYRLTPGANPSGDTWTWAAQTPTGATPSTRTANGVYGRMRVHAGSANVPRGIVYMPQHDQPVMYFRAA